MNTMSITPAHIAKVRATGKLTFCPLTDQRFRCNQLPELGVLSPARVASLRKSILVFTNQIAPNQLRAGAAGADQHEVVQIARDWNYTCSGCLARIRLSPDCQEHRCVCGRLAKIFAYNVRQELSGWFQCPGCRYMQRQDTGRRKCWNCEAVLLVEPPLPVKVSQLDRSARVICPVCDAEQWLSAGMRDCRSCRAKLLVEQYVRLYDDLDDFMKTGAW